MCDSGFSNTVQKSPAAHTIIVTITIPCWWLKVLEGTENLKNILMERLKLLWKLITFFFFDNIFMFYFFEGFFWWAEKGSHFKSYFLCLVIWAFNSNISMRDISEDFDLFFLEICDLVTVSFTVSFTLSQKQS